LKELELFKFLIFLKAAALIHESDMVGSNAVDNRNPRKNGKCDLVLGNRLCSQQLGRAMKWVDRLRTSADERVLSGRRVVVMV